jgi:hypothetical protein
MERMNGVLWSFTKTRCGPFLKKKSTLVVAGVMVVDELD